jgi:serine/threonine-protein kinase RsbW
VRGNEFIISMHDDGKPFNPSKVKAPNIKDDLSKRQIGGLGIYLMRKLMDEVHYKSIPGAGNLLTMRKRRG